MAMSLGQVKGIQWKGLDKVLSNLNKEIRGIEGRTRQGLLAAALKVKRDAIKLAPVDTGNLRNSAYVIWGGGRKTRSRVRRTGSEGTFKEDKSKAKSTITGGLAQRMGIDHQSVIAERQGVDSSSPFAEIGFTAFYALYVHENLTARHTKVDLVGRGRGREKLRRIVQAGQAKFLEQALLQNRNVILNTIKSHAKIK